MTYSKKSEMKTVLTTISLRICFTLWEKEKTTQTLAHWLSYPTEV